MKLPFELKIKERRVRVKDGGAVLIDEKFSSYEDMKRRLKKLEEKYG